MKKSIALLLLASIALSGCSAFSSSARKQRAYAKYVQKSSKGRVKQRDLFRHSKPEMPEDVMPSEPVETVSTGPESVSSSEG